ncbi:hypothetical protein ACIQOW_04175 [Kitasatospora sp. NPDC091335]|uniref:hypothetical protein n=1 Tax=Streptomycetaceae TaxID=2062 RepID=UPI001661D725|nr:hypothetical protein [Streptomyces sp. CBMA156]MBD0672478.1 hypothetical protein [Streptomyces sp. CBMA156]
MKIRRLAATAAAAAVLAPVFVLAAGTQASALPVPPSRTAQCTANWDVNYVVGGPAFARTQWKACMGG